MIEEEWNEQFNDTRGTAKEFTTKVKEIAEELNVDIVKLRFSVPASKATV